MAEFYDSDEVLVGGATGVYVAPVGTALPTTITTNFPGFVHLGYTTEDGVRPTLGRTVNDIRASQSFYPVRRVVSEFNLQVEFDLLQWNSETLSLALGGGTVTEPTDNVFKFTPAAESFIDERALLLHTVDGSKTYLWGFPRTQNTKDFTSSLVRADSAVLPVGMTALDPGTDDPFFLLTDDPAFVLAS